MVAQYGMSEKIGLMTFDGGGRMSLLPGLSPPREHSEETARLLDAEASRILGEAHVKVSTLLTDQRSLLAHSRADCWRKRWWSGTSCRRCLPAGRYPERGRQSEARSGHAGHHGESVLETRRDPFLPPAWCIGSACVSR